MKIAIILFLTSTGTWFFPSGRNPYSAGQVSAQYFVLQTSGDIYFPKRERNLKQGDRLETTDIIRFKSASAMAAVMHKENGRFDIRGSVQAVTNEWDVPVQAAIREVPPRLSMGLAIGFKKVKLFDVISAERFLVLPPGMVDVNSSQHPMDDNNTFLVKVISADTNFMVRALHEESSLVLDPARLFGNEYVPDEDCIIELIYESGGDSRETLGETGIRMVEESQLLKDVTILLELMAGDGLEKEKVFNEVYQLFESVYGAPDEWNLDQWLMKNFNLK